MGFSWADEVEKEEEEAKVNRKPNPFGAARPREVVLEEKGVDWQKLDRERALHSNLRKETTSKANTHIKRVSVSKQEQLVTEHGKKNSKCGFVNASDKIERGQRWQGFTDFNPEFIREPNAWRHHQHNCTKYDSVIHSTTSIAERAVTDSATIYNNKKRGIHSSTSIAERVVTDSATIYNNKKRGIHSSTSIAERAVTDSATIYNNKKRGIHSSTSIAERVVTDSATIYNNKKRGILSAPTMSAGPHKRIEGKHARR